MGYLTETSEWLEQIFREEIETPITGGPGGTSNIQATELANRTQKIKSTLKDNAIYIDNTEFEYIGQNIIFVNPIEMVGIWDFVYWRYNGNIWDNACNDTPESSKVVGRGIYGDWSPYEVGVAISGILPTTLPNLTPGQNIFLGIFGHETDVDGGVYLGYCIKPGLMRLFIRDYFHSDPIITIPGLRTLGITATSACVGNDSRLIHTGDVVSDSVGVTNIDDNKVTEAKQIIADNNTHDFSTTKHGYVPKGTNVGHFLKDDGTWDDPSGGGEGGGGSSFYSMIYGNYIIGRQDLELEPVAGNSSSYFYLYTSFIIPIEGNYTIKYEIYNPTTGSEIQIYRNNIIVGGPYIFSGISNWVSFSKNISGWNAGDSCQIGIKGTNTKIRNFRLCVGNPILGTSSLIYENNVNIIF